MPRFGDRWVVDRTVFDFSMGGGCQCCGLNHFLPGGVEGVIDAMSDLETDAANAEKSALSTSPWPVHMRDEVWTGRLKLRYLMKKEMPNYRQFMDEHGTALTEWCQAQDGMTLQRLFQMPRLEISEKMKTDYSIHSAFAVVLCTVTEQVANFKGTELPWDGRGDAELAFEQALVFDRRGGFMLRVKQTDGTVDTSVLQIWLDRMKSLGGPKLLERAPPKHNPKPKVDSDDEEDEGDIDEGLKKLSTGDNEEEDVDEPSSGPSFRADRRIIRLMIARYWADQMMKKFLAEQSQQQESSIAEPESKEGANSAAAD